MEHNDCGDVCTLSETSPGDLVAVKVRDTISYGIVLKPFTNDGAKFVALIEPGHPGYNNKIGIVSSSGIGSGPIFKFRDPSVTYEVGPTDFSWFNFKLTYRRPLYIIGGMAVIECNISEMDRVYLDLKDGSQVDIDPARSFVATTWTINCRDKLNELRSVCTIKP